MIIAATFLPMQDISKKIYCTLTIFKFNLPTQYCLYNNEIFFSIDYILYRLNSLKITFKKYCLMKIKLFQPNFHYLKLYIIIHFVKFIQNYKSTINYNIVCSEAVYKYFLRLYIKKLIKKIINCKF